MVAARAVRERFANALAQGEVQFADVVEFSKSRYNEDAKYLSKLRLYDILRAKPGWTDATALEALERNGYERSTNLVNIRRNPRLVANFAEILDSPAERWRARPEPVSGWPWNGKLTELIRQNGGAIPVELGGEERSTSIHANAPVSDDDIAALLDLPDPEDEEEEQGETFERDPLLAPEEPRKNEPLPEDLAELLGEI